jgi:DNA-binding GntR family transcriptional regulator
MPPKETVSAKPRSAATLKTRTYDMLKSMILSGALRPGERLHERDLTERLDVSRTPLREALVQLTNEGLIVHKPQRGHFVQSYDAKTIDDLYQLREVLESYAIRLAIARARPEHKEKLRKLAKSLQRYEGDDEQSDEELKAGQRIHEIIAEAADDSFLFDTLMRLYDRMQLFVWLDAIFADDAPKTRREHQELIRLFLEGDEEAATEAASKHVQRSQNNVRRALRVKPFPML